VCAGGLGPPERGGRGGPPCDRRGAPAAPLRRGPVPTAPAPWGNASRPVSRVLSPSRTMGDGHPSGTPVARRLERPDPGPGASNPWRRGNRDAVPVRPCSGRGLPGRPVTRPPVGSYPTISPSPAAARGGPPAVSFCGTLLRVAPTGCYPAPCSVEPGLSSTRRRDAPRPSGRLAPPSLPPHVPAGNGRNGRTYVRSSMWGRSPPRSTHRESLAARSFCHVTVGSRTHVLVDAHAHPWYCSAHRWIEVVKSGAYDQRHQAPDRSGPGPAVAVGG